MAQGMHEGQHTFLVLGWCRSGLIIRLAINRFVLYHKSHNLSLRGRLVRAKAGLQIGATWRIRLNDPCWGAMRAVALILWQPVNRYLFNIRTKGQISCTDVSAAVISVLAQTYSVMDSWTSTVRGVKPNFHEQFYSHNFIVASL